MIECLICGYASHSGFGKYPDMKCPNCGSVKLACDESWGFEP